ncbi:5-hydroxytryptamine receptor 3A-like [Engystomops pustulosus]|uniref:5-hydroxytryptamine receptor 3A-like n=1 Tax=Engystomops pustulosus TaxID=76066 RepID=UPI003AFA7052
MAVYGACCIFLSLVFLIGSYSCQNCSYEAIVNSLKFPSSSVRPAKDWREPTYIEVYYMFLYNIINVDTKKKSLTTLVQTVLAWDTEFIQWNKTEYCDIGYLSLTKDHFWKPDIYVYEMTDTEDKSQSFLFSLLYSDGYVLDFKMMRLVTSCNINIFKFPFDRQTCNMSFGSYNYPDSDIIFVSYSNSTNSYKVSKETFQSKGDWILVNITLNEDNYILGETVYSRVVLSITIQRVPQNYIVSFILPVCFMVMMDIASMFIEMKKNDRLGFKISILLGFAMLLLILNDILPLSDNPPLLGTFCGLCMALMVMSITGSIFTSYILKLSDSQTNAPHWVEILFVKYLSRILCLKKQRISDSSNMVDSDVQTGDARFKNLLEKIDSASAKQETVSEGVIQLKNLLESIINIRNLLHDNANQNNAKTVWNQTAKVLDRIFLILYVLLITALCIYVTVIWAG